MAKTRSEKETEPLSDDLKARVLLAKKLLPKSGLTTLFWHQFKDEINDSVKNKSKLSNVLQCRVTDELMTNKLEELAKLLNKKSEL